MRRAKKLKALEALLQGTSEGATGEERGRENDKINLFLLNQRQMIKFY